MRIAPETYFSQSEGAKRFLANQKANRHTGWLYKNFSFVKYTKNCYQRLSCSDNHKQKYKDWELNYLDIELLIKLKLFKLIKR